MVVVAIIGILAAVAIPAFTKYIAKAKSAEAEENLEKLALGARAYYMDPRTGSSVTGAIIPPAFPPGQAMTPIASCCSSGIDKCVPDKTLWESPTWEGLHFQISDPHYYRYQFTSVGSGSSAVFTARAFGDLDCDGLLSTFERYGQIIFNGSDVSVQGGTWRNRRLE